MFRVVRIRAKTVANPVFVYDFDKAIFTDGCLVGLAAWCMNRLSRQ